MIPASWLSTPRRTPRIAQRRNLSTAYGAKQPAYVQVRRTPSSLWVTQGSADTAAQLAALLARVAARKPGVALTLREYGLRGRRTERPVVEETTAAAA